MADSLELPTWALAFSTIGLMAATFALAYYTRALVRSARNTEKIQQDQLRLGGPVFGITTADLGKIHDFPANTDPKLMEGCGDFMFEVNNQGRSAGLVANAWITWKNGKREIGAPFIFYSQNHQVPADGRRIFRGKIGVGAQGVRPLRNAENIQLHVLSGGGSMTTGPVRFLKGVCMCEGMKIALGNPDIFD